MIPQLLDTDKTLICWLADTVKCIVSEEKNSTYELKLEYASTGKYADDIIQYRYIKVKANQTTGDWQLFKIYQVSKTLTGNVAANAEHICYGFNGYCFNYYGAFNYTSAAVLLANAKAHTDIGCGNYAFTGGTVSSNQFDYFDDVVFNGADLLSWFCNKHKFLIDRNNQVFNFTSTAISTDAVTRVVYGVNLSDYQCVIDTSSTYDSILPYYVWQRDGEQRKIVTYTGVKTGYIYTMSANDIVPLYANSPKQRTLKVKLTEMIDEQTIKDALLSSGTFNCTAIVANYMSIHGYELSNPTVTTTVNFINLADTKYYKNVVPLQQVGMHSVVNVSIPHLGVNTNTRVVSYEFDVLSERYNSITLGNIKPRISDILAKRVSK